eukprot:TRINITY_DN26453_c0_g1_i4.p2 TRINITY_DN26453_c0_g1~~TRINITY_DN26453_c0_g1_i4.p2  ORF type:complete len:304 (-),score=55.49 TRINITY_DN26453_c0_g1_i4:13-924(-)
MNYLVIGGSKSGKSRIGENIALSLNNDKVIYIATMKPFDKEDEERIRKHRKSRKNLNFMTIEKNRNLSEVLDKIEKSDTVLIDSMTSLLTNEMFIDNKILKEPSLKVIKSLQLIMNKAENTIIVSDYIFNDCILYDQVTEDFKRELANINKYLASECECVLECVFGNVKEHKLNIQENIISMKKIYKSFIMALSMFTIIPTSYIEWDDEGSKNMMKFYPFIGVIIGFIWSTVCIVVSFIKCSLILKSSIIMIVPFVLSGMLHLDGYMDVCDAILSRRKKKKKKKKKKKINKKKKKERKKKKNK